MGVSIKLQDNFIPWIKIDVDVTPETYILNEYESEKDEDKEETPKAPQLNLTGKQFSQSLYFIADYDNIKEQLNEAEQGSDEEKYLLGIKRIFDDTLRLGLYTHGRAGIYDEINYFDKNLENQILPCR